MLTQTMHCQAVIQALRSLDIYQWIAVVFGFFQIGLVSVYFAFYVHPPEVMFVSDLLYNDSEYMALMSVCVVGQLVFCVCYAFRHKKEFPYEFYIMLLAISFVVTGWFLLNTFYIDSSNEITKTHAVGVCMFIVGDIIYMWFLVRDSWYAWWKRETIPLMLRAICITVLYGSCIAMGGLFMNSFINHHLASAHTRTSTVSWIYEHTGYLLFTVAHVVFFAYETPNPLDHKQKAEQSVKQPIGTDDPCKTTISPEHVTGTGPQKI
jgi:hypothetical protein